MATPAAPTLFTLKTSTVTIEGTNYDPVINGLQLVPTTAVSTFTSINGSVYATAGATSWIANIDYAQDIQNTDSFSNYLLNSDKLPVPMVFTPVAGGPTVTATIIPVPGPIGQGDAGTAVGTAAFTVIGDPVVTPAA